MDIVSLHRLVDVLRVQARYLLCAVLGLHSTVFRFLRLLLDVMSAELGWRFYLNLDTAGLVSGFDELLVQVLAVHIVNAADSLGYVVLGDIIFD